MILKKLLEFLNILFLARFRATAGGNTNSVTDALLYSITLNAMEVKRSSISANSIKTNIFSGSRLILKNDQNHWLRESNSHTFIAMVAAVIKLAN